MQVSEEIDALRAMGFDPAAESRIEAGDCLIALGTAESLRKLEEMAG